MAVSFGTKALFRKHRHRVGTTLEKPHLQGFILGAWVFEQMLAGILWPLCDSFGEELYVYTYIYIHIFITVYTCNALYTWFSFARDAAYPKFMKPHITASSQVDS